VCRRDSNEASCSDAALNLKAKGKGYGRNSSRRSRSRKGKSDYEFGNQLECWNYGKTDTLRRIARNQGRRLGTTLQTW
jgi:hypothetical protein